MSASTLLLDPFVRGIAVGVMLVTALGVWGGGVGRDARLATLFAWLSIAAWTTTESEALNAAIGLPVPLVLLGLPVAGLFWLFVAVVFENWPVRLVTLSPAIALLAFGSAMVLTGRPRADILWLAFNLASGLLGLHAGLMILRGWRGDLIEGRRRARALVLGFAALFSAAQGVMALAERFDPSGPWTTASIATVNGAAIVAAIALASAVLFLQGRPTVFGPSRRSVAAADPRIEAADRLLLERLQAFMAEGGWRREGLAIGTVAQALAAPERRLRQLINGRLGHRNFADFVNGHRIEAAKARLGDPAEARTTIAAIAFDLGFGSLGPFNRAFRAATGATPTDWRREALAASPSLTEAG